jgi:hypothetical protein
VVSVEVNFVRSHGFDHRQFQSSLSEIDGDAVHHTEVRWLNRATVLKGFLALRLEIEMFMNVKGKVVSELSHEKWL